MIRTEREYQDAQERLNKDRELAALQEERLRDLGMSPEDVEQAMQPMLSFHQQLREEVDWYLRVRNGDIKAIQDIQDIGLLLIAVRISMGKSQKEFADMLGVSESQVSRDEKNEYHGISIDRVKRILDVCHAGIEIKVTAPDRMAYA